MGTMKVEKATPNAKTQKQNKIHETTLGDLFEANRQETYVGKPTSTATILIPQSAYFGS